jgi:hypothetical protein
MEKYAIALPPFEKFRASACASERYIRVTGAAAALHSARLTGFTPEVRNCERIGGWYVYEVAF